MDNESDQQPGSDHDDLSQLIHALADLNQAMDRLNSALAMLHTTLRSPSVRLQIALDLRSPSADDSNRWN